VAIAFSFDTQSYGTVFVRELAWEGNPDFGQWVQNVAAEGATQQCGSPSDAANIKDGQPALFSHDPGQPDSNPGLLWVEGKTRFELSGPALKKDQLIAIANAA
jgi:hypothetical protein